MGGGTEFTRNPSDDIQWNHFKLHFDLYQKYLELILKFLGFYILLSGAIISYFFAKQGIIEIKLSLLFPILIGIIFLLFFWHALNRAKDAQEVITRIATNLKLSNIPEYSILSKFIVATMVVIGFVVLGASYLLFFF